MLFSVFLRFSLWLLLLFTAAAAFPLAGAAVGGVPYCWWCYSQSCDACWLPASCCLLSVVCQLHAAWPALPAKCFCCCCSLLLLPWCVVRVMVWSILTSGSHEQKELSFGTEVFTASVRLCVSCVVLCVFLAWPVLPGCMPITFS